VSDVPLVRQPSTPEHNFSGSQFKPTNPPLPFSDKAAAFERHMLPRQLNNSRRSAANRPA
jgi:hypothetical protein